MLSSLCIGETKALPSKGTPKTPEHIGLGILTLFSQNYSKFNGVPNNIFIAKLQGNKIYDKLYSAIYGTLKSEISFNISKALKYKVTRSSRLSLYSLFPIADTILEFGVNGYTVDLMKSSETHRFCEAASIPLIHYREQPRQTGSLYICSLVPMVKCTYQISIDIKTDDTKSFVELNSPGSKLTIQKINNNVILKSYFEDSSQDIRSETIYIGNAAEKSDFEIMFDGYNKTNTILAKDGNCIVTPFYNTDRQRLPYMDFSNGYIKFTSFILGKGTHLDVDIYSINQTANRKLITAIGSNRMLAFGLDGPHVRNTTEQGIRYLNSKKNKGTIWFDIEILEQCNETDLEYLRSLVINNSWDVGVHYSKELNSLPLEQAYKVMDEGYSYVYEIFGRKPTSWCSMRNRDTVTHAIYAYENLGMLWRNGDLGIHAEKDVGNLDDDTWEWWEPASRAGMVHPIFTHELDQDPAIKYSISRSKFRNWVDNYDSNNVSIVSFYEYSQISRNTYDASFENLQYTEHSVIFDARTNGAIALVNVNTNAGKNTQVYDNTSKKFLSYNIEQDNSITFWVENNHTYGIYLALLTKHS
ncbi:hypothetical protein RG963_08500 [Methanosarcina sp. Z-7115]|uniref:Uncharacterized protein n=1 Tax=Methanosarcina baikalica TaxID=3073890 RepID=A0ABU2D1E4_9EURY|nr:hypothetical protein [Methanosarcina sp. Z-7115]MDR7665810.1 hypothetical protein [Methanosarcina sp. Z-7115]